MTRSHYQVTQEVLSWAVAGKYIVETDLYRTIVAICSRFLFSLLS